MDDFINNENTEKNETADGGFKEEESRTEEQAGTPETPFTQPQPVIQEPVYNKINYTEVKPITDYKPMSKGLRVFAAAMAGVILLTAASVTGYFLGRNKSSYTSKSKANISLAAKPANTDEMTAAQVYDKVNDSIVGITVYNTAGNGSQASGVFYSEDGYIVTNDHIYSEVPAAKFKVYTSDGKQYDAKYVAGDKIILVFCLILNVHFPVKSGNRKSILFQACCQFGSCTGTGDINNGRTAFLLDNISQTIVFFIFLIPLENLILQVGPADVATEQFETDI